MSSTYQSLNATLIPIAIAFFLVFATSAPLEAANKTWRIISFDCSARVLHGGHTEIQGTGCDRITIQAGTGTYCFAAKTIRAARIIDDLKINVEILSDRKGLQAGVRIVFPNARDQETGKVITSVIRGQLYQLPGRWQLLTVGDCRKKTIAQTQVLRLRYGRDIDLSEPYIDQVLVNVYCGRGTTNVWLGDSHSSGVVPARNETSVVNQSISHNHREKVELQSRSLTVKGHPFFPRIIESNGEPMSFLKELGFNCVATRHRPTKEQMEDAKLAKVWLIFPGTEHLESDQANRILARLLEEPLKTNRFARETNTLLVADSQASKFTADIFLSGLHRDRLTNTRRFGQSASQPRWFVIPAASESAAYQDAAILIQLTRAQVHKSIANGGKGIWFQSGSRLDRNTRSARHRREILREMNFEIKQLQPWALGCRGIENIRRGSNQWFQMSTDRAELLLSKSGWSGDIRVDNAVETARAYVLLPQGLRSLQQRRMAGGLRVFIGSEWKSAPILVTAEPSVVARFSQLSAKRKRQQPKRLGTSLFAESRKTATLQ